MERLIFWNNKGGAGKTTLAYSSIIQYAKKNPASKILIIDASPQADLTRKIINNTQSIPSDRTIGKYFEFRLKEPYKVSQFNLQDYIINIKKNDFNNTNIDILCGNPLLELQVNAISALANTTIPGTDTYNAILNWLNDFIQMSTSKYDIIFIDANPSFSIYTQIALTASTKIIIPITPDAASLRGVENIFQLIYGKNLPSAIYENYTLAGKIRIQQLPKIATVVKNKTSADLTSDSLFQVIENKIYTYLKENPEYFTKDFKIAFSDSLI